MTRNVKNFPKGNGDVCPIFKPAASAARPPSPGFADIMGEAHPQNILVACGQDEWRQRSRGFGGKAPDENGDVCPIFKPAASAARPPSPGFADIMGEAHPQNILVACGQDEWRQRSRGFGGKAPDENGRDRCPNSKREDDSSQWVQQFALALAGAIGPHLLMALKLLREVA